MKEHTVNEVPIIVNMRKFEIEIEQCIFTNNKYK